MPKKVAGDAHTFCGLYGATLARKGSERSKEDVELPHKVTILSAVSLLLLRCLQWLLLMLTPSVVARLYGGVSKSLRGCSKGLLGGSGSSCGREGGNCWLEPEKEEDGAAARVGSCERCARTKNGADEASNQACAFGQWGHIADGGGGKPMIQRPTKAKA